MQLVFASQHNLDKLGIIRAFLFKVFNIRELAKPTGDASAGAGAGLRRSSLCDHINQAFIAPRLRLDTYNFQLLSRKAE